MAVHKIFPTNIVINDVDLTDEQKADLSVAVESIFINEYSMSREHARNEPSKYGNHADSFGVFTEENMEVFPVLKDLRNIFVDGFFELAQSHDNSNMSRESISRMFKGNFSALPIIRKGFGMDVHCHPGCIASAVFYLTDVDNEKDGGQLVLRDPSWHTVPGFRNEMEYEISTRAGRLVVFPVHTWHEVKTYIGDQDRITVVGNLSYITDEDINDFKWKVY